MALLLVVGVAYASYQAQQQHSLSKIDPDINLEGKVSVELLPLEKNLSLLEAPTTKISFFEGGSYKKAAEYLKKRVAEIIYRNPWLGGWLIKDDGGDLKLYFDPSSDDVTPNIFQVFEPGQIPLSRDSTDYADYREMLLKHKAVIPSNSELVGKNAPIFQVSLVPDSERADDRFSLVVSMSHVGGDANTFFMVYNMLHLGTPIFELNPKRHPGAPEAIVQRMGEQEACYIRNAVARPLWKNIRSMATADPDNPMQLLICSVSKEWLEKQADLRQEGDDTDKEQKRQLHVSPFALIVSWFFQKLSPTVGLVAQDHRNQLEHFDVNDLDAGNYQNPVPLAQADYSTPRLVEHALQTGRRNDTGKPLPKFQLDASFSVACNWSQYKDTILSIGEGSRELLQLPLFSAHAITHLPNKLSLVAQFTATGKDERASEKTEGALLVAPRNIMNDIRDCGFVDSVIVSYPPTTLDTGISCCASVEEASYSVGSVCTPPAGADDKQE